MMQFISRRFLLLFFSLPAFALAAGNAFSPLTVTDMRCEFKTAPLGIDRRQPRLSWILQSENALLKNQSQTGYQILVASSPALLAEGKADMWNSGNEHGQADTNIPYAGKELKSGTTYYWKLRIWDGKQAASSWSKPAKWTMGLLSPGDWQASWITDSKTFSDNDSLLYQDNPAPLFRKNFNTRKAVRRATLYISGLGYYEASINGQKIGDHFLDPGWTDFRKTILYNTFDITSSLKTGANCIGVELGNGWYNPLPLKLWGGLNLRKVLDVGSPRFIARLDIEYTDGTRDAQISDATWKLADGPLRKNNNYLGSTYDANFALPGWNFAGYNDQSWRNVKLCESPGGELVAQTQPPIRQGKEIVPVAIHKLNDGKYIVDMGRNFGGVVRLQVSGSKGTRIKLRYGELLYPDGTLNVMTSAAGQIKGKGVGGPGAPDVAWQEDEMILNGSPIVFEPAFTFHGFRYVEVQGYPGTLTTDKIAGVPLSADVQQNGTIVFSEEYFNRLQEACVRTFKSNLFSVQSDCPHREKLGYGGDIVATSEAFMTNFDMHDFYAKTVRDYADEAQPDGGLPETAPYVGISDGGFTPKAAPIGWGTVLPLLLRQLYQYYGDTVLMSSYYPAARGWVEFLYEHADHLIVRPGIGDHESIDPKQLEVTGTAFFYFNAQLLKEMAARLGKKSDESRYGRLAQDIKKAFIDNFYDPATGAVGVHTEATQAFALYFGLLPEGGQEKALSVLQNEITKHKGHVSTGIFGTKYLLEVLSESGLSNLGCTLVAQQDFPGWAWMLKNGATTLWEHWDFSDNTFSHNHPMFGSVSGWFYKYLAGIRPDADAVAYDKIILQPSGFDLLKSAKASYRSPQGTIQAAWKMAGDSLYYDVVVPVNATASVRLPATGKENIRENGRIFTGSEMPAITNDQGLLEIETGSGNYHFAMKKPVAGNLTTTQKTYALIPQPAIISTPNKPFTIDANTKLIRIAKGNAFRVEADYLQTMLRAYLGKDALTTTTTSGTNTIVLRQDPAISGEEGYRLTVDQKQIVLTASKPAGIFYAMQTLRQLLPSAVENGKGSTLEVPGVSVEDNPHFGWRGMHLDVSRHFFSTAYLKKYIDMLALYKMNKLHLHLTDDQGWRIEIKKYPLLTSKGAWRSFNNHDSACMRAAKENDNPDMAIDPSHIRTVNGKQEYGGFYTQEEMKEVIQYALDRHVEIIPEIDMPGHMMAAIDLYPDLACDLPKNVDLTQGFSVPICPCRENTLEFAKNVFSEIADLFPSPYIHIGGDEVERSHWKNSAICQAFMKEHHIATLEGLQSYFNDYMQRFFKTKGKVLVGWDEIVEGGIDSSAVVMFWRPWANSMPARATGNGNKVVMSPDGPLYFDAIPDRNTLPEVYHYDPTDPRYAMTKEQEKNIWGVQANLWSEMIPTEQRADYMIMPRMTALAELGWTHRDLYPSYLRRLAGQYDRLDRLKVNYRFPDMPVIPEKMVFVDTVSFLVEPPFPEMTIHYTADGSFPSMQSPVFDKPLRIDHTTTLKIAAFTNTGRRGDVSTAVFEQQPYAASVVSKGTLTEGLACDIHVGKYNRTTRIPETAGKRIIVTAIGLLPDMPSTGIGLKFSGFLDLPETGIYTFYLTSDDGSILQIADRLVVDNDGEHPPTEKAGQIALQKGLQPIILNYIDGGGGSALKLQYSVNGGPVQDLPASRLKHE